MMSTLRGVGSGSTVLALVALLLTPAAASAATDLSVGVTGDARVRVGEQVVFSIDVRNLGAEPADAVTVRDSFSHGLEPVSAQASQGTCQIGDSVVCALGTLGGSGGRASVTVTARTTMVDRLENHVSVESQTDETDFANNRAVATVEALGPPPRLSGLRILFPVVRVGERNAFAFFMSRPGVVTFEVQRRVPGRRWRPAGIAFTGRVPAEENLRAFRGRVRRGGRVRSLRPGAYRARVTTSDDLSTPSAPRYVRFRVVR
jgi:uncharacterized repeat protein (TIGR01451 family)